MQTKQALVIVVGMALLVLLTLSPKAVDMDNPVILNQPPPEDTNCYPATISTNCTEGSVWLACTNSPTVCIGSGVSASATPTITPGEIVVTTTYTNSSGGSTGDCPPTYTTNNPSPTMVSNLWVVSGPGSYTTNGTGLTASFTPTNCGGGSVTFIALYRQVCDTNQNSTSLSVFFSVDCACNPSGYSTNCTPGSVVLTNATITTNFCLGDVVSASASQVISNGQVVVTTTYTNSCGSATTNCPNTYTTNYPSPIIVSNWWTASGGGSGSGLSASFPATNCGGGTVTFNVTYRNDTPCSTNLQPASTTASFNVDCVCHVSGRSTNCDLAGSVVLTNVSITTNVCFGSAVSASASPASTSGQVVETTTYTNSCGSVTTNCPPTYITNNPAPTIVSNWWTVSGPGSYTNTGSGLSFSFTPTNGGSGKITLNLTYSNSLPCATDQIPVSVSADFNVIQITNQCVATTPTNRARTTIGVGEEVDLWLVGSPSGTYTWSTSAGSVNPPTGTSTTLTAPDRATNLTVTVTNDTGGSCTLPFAVLEPSAESAVIYSSNRVTYPDGPPLPAGAQGAGMYLYPITVAPTNVSFYRVECLEVPGPASNITGYFTNYPATNLYHHPNPNWVTLNATNQWADEASFANYPPPWYAGGFQWVIPVQWRVAGSTNVGSLPDRTQIFSINGTNGNSTVSKLGQSVSRTP